MDIAGRVKEKRTGLNLTQLQLAQLVGVGQNSIQKIEKGDTKNPRNIEALARALKCSPEFLRFGVGDLDNATVIASANNYLPLVDLVQAGEWTDIDVISVDDAEFYPSPIKCSVNSFIVRVDGESMMKAFHPGDLLYVDPESQPINGSFVIARLDDENQATFKQLVIDGNKKYLKALNPDWPTKFIEINGNCTIVGKVVFAGKKF